MIKILIADDHPVVIDGIKLMLQNEHDIECIGSVENGKQVLSFLENNEVDVVILDINMPEMDGIEACDKIKKAFPQVRVLVLSMIAEGTIVKKMFQKSADGYILKNEGKEELILAIKNVHAGKEHFSEEVRQLLMTSFKPKRVSHFNSYIPKISRREKQVLALIVQGFTSKEIASQLFVSFNTIESHRKNLHLKLHATNAAGLVRIALENGLLDEEQ